MGQTQQYDALRRFMQWSSSLGDGSQGGSAAYDGSGQRVWQQDQVQTLAASTTTSTTYVLGVAETQIVTTTRSSGTTTTSSATSYDPLPGGLTASRDSSGLTYQATDLLGTPIAALNLASGLTGEQLRTPYGQSRYSATAATSGGMHTTFGFTGQREDTQAAGSSGLDYFNARYYDSVIGRFSSADDAQPGLGDPLGLDNYAYVNGQVETAIDPSGQACMAARGDGEGCEGGGGFPWGEIGDYSRVANTGNAISAALAYRNVLEGENAYKDPLIGRSRNGDRLPTTDPDGIGAAHDPLMRSRDGDKGPACHCTPRLSSQGGTKSQPNVQQLSLFGQEPKSRPVSIEGEEDTTIHSPEQDPCLQQEPVAANLCVSWTGAGGGESITNTWKTNLMLSNGQTNAEFRASATNCFYCGIGLDSNNPRRSARPVTGHIYPRNRALERAASQEVYNAYVIDVRGLRPICNSCNGIQGGYRAPIDMVLRWRPGGQAETQAIFDFIGQLYGFEP